MLGRTCTRCGYERKEDDTAPSYKCPSCGRPYIKDTGKQKEVHFETFTEAQQEATEEPSKENKPSKDLQKEIVDIIKLKNPIDKFDYSGFIIRVVAYIIDIIIVIGYSIFFILNSFDLEIYFFGGAVFLLLCYKPLLETFMGGTFGKLICGIRVKNKRGKNINLLQAFIRFLPDLIRIGALLFTMRIIFQFTDITVIKDLHKLDMNIIRNLSDEALQMLFVHKIASLIFVIDVIFIIFNKRKRAIHDYIAGTYCVWNS
ncbi:MAG: RDD family protein [Candidatus Aureabacteria bacterium]|nr:RDD family protein [Candidatus Auribacterota bacterium]